MCHTAAERATPVQGLLGGGVSACKWGARLNFRLLFSPTSSSFSSFSSSPRPLPALHFLPRPLSVLSPSRAPSSRGSNRSSPPTGSGCVTGPPAFPHTPLALILPLRSSSRPRPRLRPRPARHVLRRPLLRAALRFAPSVVPPAAPNVQNVSRQNWSDDVIYGHVVRARACRSTSIGARSMHVGEWSMHGRCAVGARSMHGSSSSGGGGVCVWGGTLTPQIPPLLRSMRSRCAVDACWCVVDARSMRGVGEAAMPLLERPLPALRDPRRNTYGNRSHHGRVCLKFSGPRPPTA